jgi:hypothetical protein
VLIFFYLELSAITEVAKIRPEGVHSAEEVQMTSIQLRYYRILVIAIVPCRPFRFSISFGSDLRHIVVLGALLF